ncbi:hypothetical protein EON64_07615, partial [archaeon]
MVCLTAVSILAVDFSVFPRYLAKTEMFGLSLMDLGTGAYLVSSAATSRRARDLEDTISSGSGNMMLLLLLGLGRPLLLAALGYPQHRSEYGRHWSFFLTLLFVWVAALLLHRLLGGGVAVACLAVVGLAAYQSALSLSPLSAYLLDPAHLQDPTSPPSDPLGYVGYLVDSNR